MSGRGRAARTEDVRGSDGERLEPLTGSERGTAVPATAAEVAEARLKGQVVRAVRVLERVLRVGEARGLTVEEYERSPKYWEFARKTAETTLRLALSGGKAGSGPGRPKTAKAGSSSAEAEPEDDSGVPADLFSHLR